MNARHETMIWLAALACAAFAARRMSGADETTVRSMSASGSVAVPTPMEEDSLEALESTVADGNVFRLARRPAAVAFALRDGRPMMSAPPPPPVPKVALTLKAIIGGPPWEGVIEGFPGHDGATVVRSGDKIDRFDVRTIDRDIVVIQSPDSTYRLSLKRQW